MKLKQLLADDGAVSPVIGVILMVAITVILAAVIGTFVLGLGSQVSEAQPSANIQFSYSGSLTTGASPADEVSVTHTGGDPLDPDDLTITIGGDEAWTSAGATGEFADDGGWASDPITAGDELVLDDGPTTPGTGIESGDVVRVIWAGDSGDTAIIAQGTVS